jgi:hypothetical protein
MTDDNDDLDWLAGQLTDMARRERGLEPLAPEPRRAPAGEEVEDEAEDEVIVHVRGLIERLEGENGVVPPPNASLAVRLAHLWGMGMKDDQA